MDTRKAKPLETAFWCGAFRKAELSVLLRKGARITPAGLAHLAAEYADAALREYGARFSK